MVDQKNTFYNWQTSGPGFPWRQLILGALVPIAIFYTLYRLGQPLTGALIAIGWSISLLVVQYWRSRSIELFPALAIPIVLIELIGTLITRNPDFYLASAAIDNVLWGLLFLGSLLYIKSWQRKRPTTTYGGCHNFQKSIIPFVGFANQQA